MFEKHLFAVAVPLGLITVIIGAFLSAPAIGAGLMFGGIFSVCDGYFNYWSELSAQLKFSSLLAALIVLLVVGYRKLEKKETAIGAGNDRQSLPGKDDRLTPQELNDSLSSWRRCWPPRLSVSFASDGCSRVRFKRELEILLPT